EPGAMTLEALPSEPANGNVIEVRYDAQTNLWLTVVFAIAITFPIALGGLAQGWFGLLRPIIAAPFFFTACGYAGYFAWCAFDRRPVLVLDENGLRDRRLGSVLLPWARLRRASHEVSWWIGQQANVRLQFDRVIIINPRGMGSAVSEIVVRLGRLEMDVP